MTSGSLLFAGTGGLLSQDNANLFWDNPNKRMLSGPRTGFATTSQGIYDGSRNAFSVQNPSSGLTSALSSVVEDNTVNAFSALYGSLESRHTSGGRTFVGIEGDAYQTTAGNVNGMAGVSGFAKASAGTVIDLAGAGSFFGVEVAGATVTNAYGLYADSNVRSSGTLTNNYGLFIADQAGVGTNNWAIKTGTGQVQFGDALSAKAISQVRYADQFTGADAGAKIIAAIADLPSTGGTVDARGLEGAQTASTDFCTGIGAKPVVILLGATTLTVSATQTCNTEKISILGLGPSQTILNCTVNGDCLRIRTSAFNTNKAGVFGGFQMVGNSGANAVAIHIGDIIGARLRDLWIVDFTGASSAGIWLDNITNWTEQTLLDNVRVNNATKNLRFTVNGGTNSFSYQTFSHVSLEIQNSQTAISSENNADVIGSFFDVTINKSGAASGTILSLTDTSSWNNNNYHIVAENNGGGGGTGISIAVGASLQGSGTIVAAGLANSISGTFTTTLDHLSGTATTGIIESAQTIAARTSAFLGSYLQPQLGASGGFRQALGLNLHFDGSNWITEGDGGANNGAVGILGTYGGTTELQFFTVNSTGASDQSITNADFDSNNLRAKLNSVGLGIGTATPSSLLALGGNAARVFQMERHTTADTAGNSLTMLAGGATSGATNRAGGALLLQSGLGTGNAVPGLLRVQQDALGTASGTADHARVDRLITGASKILTDGVGIALVNATIANDTVVAGSVRYAVEVFNGTDLQVEEGQVSYHATNKAGTVANNTTVKFGNQQATTSGTLTCTWTITAANPAVLSLNCDTSLTPSAGYPRVTFALENLTQQAVAIQ
jgi:hypothetical protein